MSEKVSQEEMNNSKNNCNTRDYSLCCMVEPSFEELNVN